jgi:hypothetical protein
MQGEKKQKKNKKKKLHRTTEAGGKRDPLEVVFMSIEIGAEARDDLSLGEVVRVHHRVQRLAARLLSQVTPQHRNRHNFMQSRSHS